MSGSGHMFPRFSRPLILLVKNFWLQYEYEIEYEYDFRILIQSRFLSPHSSLLYLPVEKEAICTRLVFNVIIESIS